MSEVTQKAIVEAMARAAAAQDGDPDEDVCVRNDSLEKGARWQMYVEAAEASFEALGKLAAVVPRDKIDSLADEAADAFGDGVSLEGALADAIRAADLLREMKKETAA